MTETSPIWAPPLTTDMPAGSDKIEEYRFQDEIYGHVVHFAPGGWFGIFSPTSEAPIVVPWEEDYDGAKKFVELAVASGFAGARKYKTEALQ